MILDHRERCAGQQQSSFRLFRTLLALFTIVMALPGRSGEISPAIQAFSIQQMAAGAVSTGLPSPPPEISFAGISPANATPPDSHGAVGPDHVLTQINGTSAVHNRNGALLASTTLTGFWASLGVTDVFDPRVLFDPHSNRFIAIACADRRSPTSGMLFGITQTSDPAGNWFLWLLDADNTNINWLDYPNIGVTASRITITGNLFSTTADNFAGVDIWTIDKSSALDGGGLTLQLLKVSNAGGTLVPALTYDAAESTQYLIRTGTSNIFGTGRLQMYSITGNIGALSFNPAPLASVGSAWGISLPDARQLGSAATIETNDDRLMGAVIRNGRLWTAHTVALSALAQDHSAVKWWEIEASSGTVIQSGLIEDVDAAGNFNSATGANYYYPSIAVNAANDVLIGFSGSGAQEYVSAYYAYRPATAPAGLFNTPYRFKSGLGVFTGPRWGDYSAAVVDPVDGTTFWTVQEYAEAGNKGGNYWAKVNQGAPDTTKPRVAGALALNTTSVRVTFDEPMQNNAALVTPAAYTFSGGLAASGVARLNSTQVSVTVNEMKNGANYAVAVSTNGPTDTAGNTVSPSGNTKNFTGLGIAPTATISLNGANPTNLNTVVFGVNFSESVGTTFTASDVSISGTLASGAGKIVAGGPVQFTVLVTPANPNADGTLGISIAAGSTWDAAGNLSGGAGPSGMFNIDNTPPVITRLGAPEVTAEVGGSYTDAGATAADARDGNLTPNIATHNPVNTAAIGNYTVTYNVSDSAGNAAAQVSRTVYVADTTPPTIRILGDVPAFVDECLPYSDAGATASDNIDGDLTPGIVINGTVDTSAPGGYTLTYHVTDSGGTAAAPAVRTVYVLAADSDGDGLENCEEIDLGTDPLLADTDGDGIPDATEVASGTDPRDGQSLNPNVYVDGASGSDATGAGTKGAPWATVAHAVAAVEGNAAHILNIHVAAGAYTVLNKSGGTLRLDSYEHLLGGYEATGWTRDTKAQVTVLDASVAVGGAPADNAIVLDSIANILLDGFTVTGADSTGNAHTNGAGILAVNLDSSSVIRDCLVMGNSANNAGAGGILLIDASPSIISSAIAANDTAGVGGGLRLEGGSNPDIARCVISGNAGLGGGGVYLDSNASALITNSIISGNASGGFWGSGMYLLGNATVVNSTIAHNGASDLGGAGVVLATGAQSFVNCLFAGNVNSAIVQFESGGDPILDHCLFQANTVSDYFRFNGSSPISLTGAPNLNAQLPGAIGNVDGDPRFKMSPAGTWTAAPAYNAATHRTTLTDAAAAFAPGALRGALIALSPDSTFQALVLGNTATTVEILADYSALVASGDAYQLADYHLKLGSAAIDMGRDTSAPPDGVVVDDFDGVARGFNGGGQGAATGDGSGYDIGAFECDTALPGAIHVTSPNGGETILQGTAAAITWTSTGNVGPNVQILARKGTGLGIIAASTPNVGTFNWNVSTSFPTGAGFTIEISSVENPGILDQSDNFFTVAAAPPAAGIAVTSPNGGETVYRGTVLPITWTSTGTVGSQVKITVWKGARSAVVVHTTPNDGAYEWAIPASYTYGSGFLVEISSVSAPAIADTSDLPFTVSNVLPPGGSITVATPNGGEVYLPGNTVPIAWTWSGAVGGDVRINLQQGAQTFVLIASTANDGAFDWTVPQAQAAGANYTIAITSLSDAGITDTSNAAFTINSGPPQARITVTAPNGGETLTRGGAAPITWTSTGAVGGNVKIVARKGAQSAVIANTTPNDGVYDWNVPTVYPHGPGFLIEISSVADPAIVDASDAAFTISP